MKKILCLALAVLMVLSLCACGGDGKTKVAATFQVGYAREDITPTTSMPLAGYGQTDKRMSTNVLDNLYATCVAITDVNGETILLFSTDLVNSSNADTIRPMIEQATGIPADHIMLAATHTHSAPDQDNAKSDAWEIIFFNKCVAAAEAALADRSEAEIYIGTTETENMNFIRHYLMLDGTYFGDNFGNAGAGYKDHASPNDPLMQVIKFARAAEDKKDVIMVNWQAHPCITGGIDKTDMSADFVGSTRTYVEYQTKQNFIYFTGAAGNHNAKTYLPGEAAPPTDYQAYGALLGQDVLEAMENMTKLEAGEIKTTEITFTGEVDHSKDDKVEDAQQVVALYNATDRATGNVLAHELGFTSVYEASGVISKSKMAATSDMKIAAFSVGDLGFIAAPYEMFADHGMYIKENSPAKMTFVISCCNGSNGYLPTVLAYDYVCYESTTGKFARGTGDLLAEKFVELLKEQRAEG